MGCVTNGLEPKVDELAMGRKVRLCLMSWPRPKVNVLGN